MLPYIAPIAFAALSILSFIAGIWSRDDRWHSTGAVLILTAAFSALLIAYGIATAI